jgi:hypothetical protein
MSRNVKKLDACGISIKNYVRFAANFVPRFSFATVERTNSVSACSTQTL